MSKMKSLFNWFTLPRCTNECKYNLQELEEKSDINQDLRREIHVRNDQIMSLQSKVNDLSKKLNHRPKGEKNGTSNASEGQKKAQA